MSGLFGSLNASTLALSAQSRALDVAGKNLANVNNASYSRERVVFGDQGTVATPQGAESLGLQAVSVEQLRDNLLDQQVMREGGFGASYTAEQQGYQSAQAALGQSISTSDTSDTATNTGGIAASIDGFFNAFQSFAANPSDTGERQTLLANASTLTDRLQQADQGLAQTQTDLSTRVTSDVTSANTLLQSIATLNGQISKYEAGNPGSAVDLRDQREAQLEQLAAIMPIQTHDQSNGAVQVVTKDAGGNDIVLVDKSAVQGAVAFSGTQITAGSSNTAVAVTSGSIQGELNARDGGIQALRNQLNAISKQLVTSVNTAYNPTGLTGNFFTAANITAGTISIDPTVTAANLKASDGGPAGDNTVALAVAAVANKTFSVSGGDLIDGTIAGAFSSSVSQLGQALATTNSNVTNQTSIQQLVVSQRDAVSGVNLDEEVADLTKFQRAFEASSRVFSTINDLLDNVVNKLGVG